MAAGIEEVPDAEQNFTEIRKIFDRLKAKAISAAYLSGHYRNRTAIWNTQSKQII